MGSSSQQFCLRWNNHQSNMLNVFEQLLQNEALVDVTLACDGLSLKAHRVVLSACSPYFQSLFLDNPCQHPIVFLKDVRFADLRALVDFMYKGEVNVSQEQLNVLLATAESLKVRGLAEVTPENAAAGAGVGGGGDNAANRPRGGSGIPSDAVYQQAAAINKVRRSSSTAIIDKDQQQQQQQPSGLSTTTPTSLSLSLSLSSSSSPPPPLLQPQQQQQPSTTGSSAIAAVAGATNPASPPLPLPLPLPRLFASSRTFDHFKRCHSPPAKRRKAKPRKRIAENSMPSDHENSIGGDASPPLDLSTASPEMIEACMDVHRGVSDNNNLEPPKAATTTMTTTNETRSIGGDHLLGNNNNNNNNSVNQFASALHLDVDVDNYQSHHEGTYGNPNQSLASPSSGFAASSHRMSMISKVPTLMSVITTAPLPSTSATQASIEDIRRLCQYSRQSQQHKPTWTEEDMVQALEAVQSGRLTYALAARKFDIPKATLHYYVILMKAVEAVRSGRMTAEIAAIKYNVRTSILLDCLFGRQGSSASSSTTSTSSSSVAVQQQQQQPSAPPPPPLPPPPPPPPPPPTSSSMSIPPPSASAASSGSSSSSSSAPSSTSTSGGGNGNGNGNGNGGDSKVGVIAASAAAIASASASASKQRDL